MADSNQNISRINITTIVLAITTAVTCLMCVLGVLAFAAFRGVLRESMLQRMPPPIQGNGIPSSDWFYYGGNGFLRNVGKKEFTTAYLKGNQTGPWIWLDDDSGFLLGSDSATNCAERVRAACECEVDGNSQSVFVRFGAGKYIRFDDKTLRTYDDDAVIKSPSLKHPLPIRISLTKDGPRLQMPFTEEELRKAFGQPDKIETKLGR